MMFTWKNILLLLSITICFVFINSAILSQKQITEGLTSNYTPKYVFYYGNSLYAALSSNQGSASIFQYDATGSLTQQLSLPLACKNSTTCTVDIGPLVIEENIVYAYASTTDHQYEVYSIDLDTFTIAKSKNFTYLNYTHLKDSPANWFPIDSDLLLWPGKSKNNTEGLFLTNFNLTSLQLPIKSKYMGIVNTSPFFGGASSGLASRNKFVVCGTEASTNNAQYSIYDREEDIFILSEFTKTNYGCQYASFVGNTTRLVIANYIESQSASGMTVVDLDGGSLPNPLLLTEVAPGLEVLGLLADGTNNAFLFLTKEGTPETNIMQTFINKTHIHVYDQEMMEGYGVQNLGVNIQSLGISPNGGQFAVIANALYDYSTFGIVIVNYDTTKAY